MSEDIKRDLADQWWRLNNLYYIVDKRGKEVLFKPNWAQKHLYQNMWYMSIILKARQLGMTTFIQLFMLDCCLFNANVSAGVVAHNREDAEDFFSNKIKYAYDRLPSTIRAVITATTDSARQLAFSNGSSIRVGTSLRSGTLQYLHVSEFGKICAKYPDKAEEIIAGSLNTVEAGQFVFIESTAEGAFGRFYSMCQDAMGFAGELTPLDFKFFFFPWWKHPHYKLSGVHDPDETLDAYFAELEQKGVRLNAAQQHWYAKKKAVQKSKMQQEYPSTPEEAFTRISEFAVYGKELGAVRSEGRLTSLPVNPSIPVDLFLDLGRSKTDATCIWFMQHIGAQFHFIDYYQNTQQNVAHYVKVVADKGYLIRKWYIPHDGGHNDYDMQTYEKRLRDAGVRDIQVVPRIPELRIGIDMVREVLPSCLFDKDRCAEGVAGLEGYRYEYDERDAVTKGVVHNWASHPSDAFRQFAQGYPHRIVVTPQLSERRREAIRRNSRASRSWVV